jgi:hypothetical protein
MDVVRSVPKESHEIFQLIRKIGVTIKAKGNYMDLISDLVRAVDGVSYLKEEIQEAKFEIAADGVAEILGMIEDMSKIPAA